MTWKYDFNFIISNNVIFSIMLQYRIKIFVFLFPVHSAGPRTNCYFCLYFFLLVLFCVYYVNWFQKCFGRRFLTPDGLTYFSSGCESVAVSKKNLLPMYLVLLNGENKLRLSFGKNYVRYKFYTNSEVIYN